MIVITVARKPLNGTVANNALKYGTGGINIDACRVGMNRPPTDTRTFKAWRRAEGRTDLQEPKPDLRTNVGRFPANLILQHLDGCKCTGMKEVKTDSPTPDRIGLSRDGNFTLGIYGAKGSKITSGYASAEGKETVPAWDCLPGCPVAELDRQSGKSVSTGGFKPGSTGAFGKSGIYSKAEGQEQPPGFGDVGGASRFFKQIQDASDH